VRLGGGAPEMALLGERKEVADVPELHARILLAAAIN
jgi:hypothetical protein